MSGLLPSRSHYTAYLVGPRNDTSIQLLIGSLSPLASVGHRCADLKLAPLHNIEAQCVYWYMYAHVCVCVCVCVLCVCACIECIYVCSWTTSHRVLMSKQISELPAEAVIKLTRRATTSLQSTNKNMPDLIIDQCACKCVNMQMHKHAFHIAGNCKWGLSDHLLSRWAKYNNPCPTTKRWFIIRLDHIPKSQQLRYKHEAIVLPVTGTVHAHNMSSSVKLTIATTIGYQQKPWKRQLYFTARKVLA